MALHPPLVPSGTSSTQESTQSLPRPPSHARSAGKLAKRYAEAFESATKLEKRHDFAMLEWNDVNLGPLLGQGSFASVYQVSLATESCKQTKQSKQYALKCLRAKIVEENKRTLTHATTDMALEAKLLQHLSHENIIQVHAVKAGCILKSTCEPGGGFFFIMDYCELTLAEQIETWKLQAKQKRRNKCFLFPRMKFKPSHEISLWNRLQSSALGIARGLEYLHVNGVHHGDVKPKNIAFSQGNIKLIDFGLARETFPDGKSVLPERWASTARYAAPEIFPNERESDAAADVYSFAIVLWQIASLKRPFKDIMNHDEFERKVVNGSLRPSLKYIPTKSLRNLITQMWHHSPEERPTMSIVRQVLQDEIESVLGCNSSDSSQEDTESTSSTDCSVQSQAEQESLAVSEGEC